MSPAASSVRSTLLVQAAVTLLFGLLRPGASTGWTAMTVLVAVAAVGLAAALQATATFRTAVLGFEGGALAFGALGLVAGHYVPGTIIGISLLIRLAQTSAAEFAAAPPVPFVPPVDAPGGPPAAQAPWAVPAPAVAPPVAAPPAPWPSSAPGPAVASAWAVPAAPAAPSFGVHPGGTTVLPMPPAVPVQAVPVPAPVPPPVVPAQSAAPAVAPSAPQVPSSAPACMTILPG